MKRFVHAKNIVLWVAAAILVFTSIMLFAYSPKACSTAYGVFNGTGYTYEAEQFWNVSKTGSTTINVGDLLWVKTLPGNVERSYVVNGNPFFVVGPLLVLFSGLLIVGLSFLKPCKLRGWGFIGCIAIAIAGIVFFVIGVTKFGDSINSYMKIKFSYGGKDYTVRSWVNEIYVKDAQNVSRQEFVNVSMSMTNSTIWWLYFPILALPTLIVGMALRAPKAKEEKVPEEPKVEDIH